MVLVFVFVIVIIASYSEVLASLISSGIANLLPAILPASCAFVIVPLRLEVG